jgi:energy-coupling factor transporter ATP-binding protein EcfA2
VIDLFKLTGLVRLNSPGLEVEWPLGPAVVLFGPNDSGKTNTLRTLTAMLQGREVEPRDPLLLPLSEGSSLREVGALVLDLDLSREEHRALALSAVLSPADSGPIDVYVSYEEGSSDDFSDMLEVPPSGFTPESFLVSLVAMLANDDEEVRLLVDPAHLGSPFPAMLSISSTELSLQPQPAARLSGIRLPRLIEAYDRDPFKGLVEVIAPGGTEEPDSMLQQTLREQVLRLAGRGTQREGGLWIRDLTQRSGPLFYRTDPWLSAETSQVAEEVASVCAYVSETATEIAPSFIKGHYRIELQPLPPAYWEANGGHRLRLALVPHEPRPNPWPENLVDVPPAGFRIDAVGAGLRVWTLFAVHEAFRRKAAADLSAAPPQLFVFDEPERHLHPSAQREAAEFVAEIVTAGANIVVATHSPTFLNVAIPNAEYVRLYREDGVSRAAVIGAGRLAAIEGHLEQLGLSRSDLIHLTRAALLVEGEHDRAIIRGFFGNQLDDAYVRILTLRGTDNALALLDAELLQQLDIPIHLMLDNTRRETVEAIVRGRLGGTRLRKEERVLLALATALRGGSMALTPLALPVPDIVWTLPEEAMRRAVPSFTSWRKLQQEFKAEPRPMNPKDFLASRLGVTFNLRFIQRVLAIAGEFGYEPSPKLRSAIYTVIQRANPAAIAS